VSASATGRGYWFPLVVFGVVILAATGFYWQTFPSCPHARATCVVARTEPINFATSGFAPLLPFQNHWMGVYWLTAIPIGFLLSIWFFKRRGSAGSVVLAAAVSVALLALVVARSSLVGLPLLVLPGSLTLRGLLAILLIGVGLVVWAVAERSVELGMFVGAFFVVALFSCLYDVSNVASFGSSPSAEELPNVVLPGLFLLLGGIGFGIFERSVTQVAPA